MLVMDIVMKNSTLKAVSLMEEIVTIMITMMYTNLVFIIIEIVQSKGNAFKNKTGCYDKKTISKTTLPEYLVINLVLVCKTKQ